MIKAKLVLAAVAATVLVAGPALADGEKTFKKCAACHTLDGKNKVGPSLQGVVGRAAGAAEGFKYSDAMKGAGLTWDEATLTKYLMDPKGTIPGNKMAFPGLKDEGEIKEVIEYIKGH